MTYWGYHLLFTLPWIAIGIYLVRKHIKLAHLICFLVVSLIVMLFTTPWDNYAAYLGIWGFGEDVSLGYPFRSMADKTPWLGHIPFEEYSFFIIEAAMVCLVTLYFIRPKNAEN